MVVSSRRPDVQRARNLILDSLRSTCQAGDVGDVTILSEHGVQYRSPIRGGNPPDTRQIAGYIADSYFRHHRTHLGTVYNGLGK